MFHVATMIDGSTDEDRSRKKTRQYKLFGLSIIMNMIDQLLPVLLEMY
jgi:hypothetical protein